jgi:anti-sigma B factor antagonist
MDGPDRPLLALTSTAHAEGLVIHLKGTLDFLNVPLFRREVDAALEPPRSPTLIIDVSAVGLCDSAGLAELVHTLRRSEAVGTRIMLAGVPVNMKRRLTITGLAGLFDSHPSLDDALRHARPAPGEPG